MSHLIERAQAFAIERHGDQKRKWTGDPYWHHLRNVANLVGAHGGTPEMIAAAWLHDVIEDTRTYLPEILPGFGPNVMTLVFCLTDKSMPEDGNREKRKNIDRENIAGAPPDAQTIKLADLIDNTSSIVEHDKNFARVYLAEMEALLEVLTKGEPLLRELAYETLREAQQQLVQHSLSKAKDGIR